MSRKPPPHPMQPVVRDEGGVVRFRENKLVRYMLDSLRLKGVDLNVLACVPVDPDDREQFYQLIGYSIDGYAELSFISEGSVKAADAQAAKLKHKMRKQ